MFICYQESIKIYHSVHFFLKELHLHAFIFHLQIKQVQDLDNYYFLLQMAPITCYCFLSFSYVINTPGVFVL